MRGSVEFMEMSEIQKSLTVTFISRRIENWENPIGKSPPEKVKSPCPPPRVHLRGWRALAHS